MEKVVKREQVMICPNGIPDIDKMQQKRHNAIPHLLFLSNLIGSKGVIDLLDACEILKEKGYQFVCNFIGSETKEIDTCRFGFEVHKRGLDEVVFYLGCKYGGEKNEIFANSDIFVFPTYYPNECFPLVLLEAMRHGLVVVSTDEGGITDLVINEKNGYLVKTKNAEVLADSIEKLILDEDLRKAMGEEGRNMFIEKFTLDEFVGYIKNCLIECIET